MPTIGRIGTLEIMVFRNDRDPPHFHVFGAEFSAKFAIADLVLLSSKGRIRRRILRRSKTGDTNIKARYT